MQHLEKTGGGGITPSALADHSHWQNSNLVLLIVPNWNYGNGKPTVLAERTWVNDRLSACIP
jgi:hypothetical protein